MRTKCERHLTIRYMTDETRQGALANAGDYRIEDHCMEFNSEMLVITIFYFFR